MIRQIGKMRQTDKTLKTRDREPLHDELDGFRRELTKAWAKSRTSQTGLDHSYVMKLAQKPGNIARAAALISDEDPLVSSTAFELIDRVEERLVTANAHAILDAVASCENEFIANMILHKLRFSGLPLGDELGDSAFEVKLRALVFGQMMDVAAQAAGIIREEAIGGRDITAFSNLIADCLFDRSLNINVHLNMIMAVNHALKNGKTRNLERALTEIVRLSNEYTHPSVASKIHGVIETATQLGKLP